MTLGRLKNPQRSTKFSSIKKTCSLKRKVCNDLSDLEKETNRNLLKEKLVAFTSLYQYCYFQPDWFSISVSPHFKVIFFKTVMKMC